MGIESTFRLWLSLIAYNLGHLWRRLVLPKKIENWSSDQLAATAGEDRGQADQARPVLLASVGRGPPDAPGVRSDSAEDLGAAVTGGVRTGGSPGRKGSEEKKEGRWSVRELGRKHQSCRLAPDLRALPPTSSWVLVQFRRLAANTWSQSRRLAVCFINARIRKWKSRLLPSFGKAPEYWEKARRATEWGDLVNKSVTRTLCLLAAVGFGLSAESISFTGTLSSPEDVFETTFTLTAADTVTFQTWGFGGGTNAAGQVIPAGGFDSLIALFSGPVATATMYVDGFGNPLADADNLSNPPWSYVGNCPPAGLVAIGTDNDCGDDFMQAALGAGTYTLVLTDANYVPNAVYDNGALSEGFTDFTGGVFQTCDSVSNDCITPGGNYGVDIVSAHSDLTTPTPEPSALPLLAVSLMALGSWKQFRKRRRPPNTKGDPS
jgi:hypothetical protein